MSELNKKITPLNRLKLSSFKLPLYFWLSMLSFAIVISSMVYYLILQNESRIVQAAQISSNGLASFVGDYLEKHQLLVKSIASHHQDRILQLSKGGGYPYDLAEITEDIRSLFPSQTEFAIINPKGDIVIGSNLDQMGEKCHTLIKETMKSSAAAVSRVSAHRSPSGEYHFDVLFPIIAADEMAGFWVKLSFKPLERFIVNLNIKEYDLVITEQMPPYHVLLGKDITNKARAPLSDNFEYLEQELEDIVFKDVLAIAPISSVAWQVRAIQNTEVYRELVEDIIIIALAVFLAVFFVVTLVYLFVRGVHEEKEKIRQDAVHDQMFNAGPTILLEKQTDQYMSILYASPNVSSLFGKSSKEVVKTPYLDWICPDDALMVRQTLLDAFKGKTSTVEMVYRIKNANNEGAKWIYDLSHILYNSAGKPESIRGYITSVHAQKTAEKNATDLIQSVPEAIFVLDLDGKIVNTNRAAEYLLACDKEALVNVLFSHWLEAESLVQYEHVKRQFIGALTPEKEPLPNIDTFYLRDSKGHQLSVEISFNHIELNGEPLLVQVVRDVTLQMQVQQQLSFAKEQAEALAKARSRFVATISHEIRTPMNGVLGMTDLLFDTALTPQQEQYLQAIKHSGDVLLSIINEVLDFAKLDEGQVVLNQAEFNLKGSIEETLHLLSPMAEEKGLALSFNYSDQLPENYLGDVLRMQQLLFNLVGNALKFTETGQVQIQVSPVAGDISRLLIEVVDSGIGVASEHLNKLFDSFTQADESTSRQFGGTGLGLAICKQLVDLMGGSIGVSSELNKGSTFWVKLPLEATQSVDETQGKDKQIHLQNPDDSPLPLAGKTVLLIEDNSINQRVIEAFVERLGAKIDIAENGLKGVDYWRLDAHKYQLILMDCQMPVMDGFEATKIIRKEERMSLQSHPIPIIALTANVLTEDKEKCYQVGMDDFLAKPINREQFDATLIKWAG
ncbi:PAS domain-containing hybrid sensor histidine kinase/response regulator [Thiomicrorhabdus immobilis]|nr:ATP-binding protein [Thiomicrorhabdus immobilis]